MLPDYLLTTYRRYKEDTNYIATYLANTAKGCGYVTGNVDPEIAVEKPKKLTGRARTMARRAAQSDAQSIKGNNDLAPESTYKIAVKDFITMAQCIASSSKVPVNVPKGLLKILDRAISLRKTVSQAMMPQQSPISTRSAADVASDSRHAVFVEILVKVRQLLNQLVPQATRKQTKPHNHVKAPEKAGIDITNMFESLDLEELPEESSEDDGISAKPHAQSDLQKMREQISTCWKDYEKGATDLMAASLTSNTALELARRMEEDLGDFTACGGVEQHLETYHNTLSTHLLMMPEYNNLTVEEFETATYRAVPEAHWYLAYRHLKLFQECGRGMTTYNTVRGTYNCNAEWSTLSGSQNFVEDHRLLSDFFSDLSLLERAQSVAGYKPESEDDDLTRGFHELFASDKVSLRLVFATQVFLDIHHILRGKSSRAFENLQYVGTTILNAINAQLEFQKCLDKPLPSFLEYFVCLSDTIKDFCKTDFLHEVRQETDVGRTAKVEKFQLLKLNPVSCGIKLYIMKSMYRRLSLDFANNSSSILACAHLSNALVKEGYLQQCWHDMDFLHVVQDVSNMYAGDPPGSPDDYLKRFCVAVLGVSITNFARNRRRPTEITYKASGWRKLPFQTPVYDVFFCRYYHDRERKSIAPQDMWEILKVQEKGLVMEKTAGEEASRSIAMLRKARPQDRNPLPKSDRNRMQKTNPSDVLHNLHQRFRAETFELSTDYLTLHRICTAVLCSIQKSVEAQMEELYMVASKSEDRLLSVVLFILSALAREKGDPKISVLPQRKDHYEGIGEELMQIAATKLLRITSMKLEGITDGKGGEVTSGNAVTAWARRSTGMLFECKLYYPCCNQRQCGCESVASGDQVKRTPNE